MAGAVCKGGAGCADTRHGVGAQQDQVSHSFRMHARSSGDRPQSLPFSRVATGLDLQPRSLYPCFDLLRDRLPCQGPIWLMFRLPVWQALCQQPAAWYAFLGSLHRVCQCDMDHSKLLLGHKLDLAATVMLNTTGDRSLTQAVIKATSLPCGVLCSAELRSPHCSRPQII